MPKTAKNGVWHPLLLLSLAYPYAVLIEISDFGTLFGTPLEMAGSASGRLTCSGRLRWFSSTCSFSFKTKLTQKLKISRKKIERKLPILSKVKTDSNSGQNYRLRSAPTPTPTAQPCFRLTLTTTLKHNMFAPIC